MVEDIVQRRLNMKRYGIIYCAYNKINHKRYIGQTIRLLCERKSNHYTHDPEIYFHRALRKYKVEDWEWSEIDYADSQDELNEKEKYWIEYYKTKNPEKGYNILDGGSNSKPSSEQVRYARERFVQLYSKDNADTKQVKNIRCVETQQIFKTAAEAARTMGISHSHIVEAANGKLKSAGGYHWEWCFDISLFSNALYCKELDKYYLSYNEARTQDHFSGTHLSRAYKEQGSPFTYAGYTFYKING